MKANLETTHCPVCRQCLEAEKRIAELEAERDRMWGISKKLLLFWDGGKSMLEAMSELLAELTSEAAKEDAQ